MCVGCASRERDMVKKRAYIPDRGDVVWVDFNPTRGHEQQGRRPAVVISPKNYNNKSGLALLCPVTSVRKGYPFEILVYIEHTESVILVDQVRSLDWKERRVEKINSISEAMVIEVQKYLRKLVGE